MAASTGCTRNAVGSSTWKKDYRCTRCQGTAHPLDGRPQKEIQVGPDKLEVVASFCYLGDMLSAAGGCKLSTTTRQKTAWKKFKDLIPVLSSRHLSFKTRGREYSSCVRSAMLHASETWQLTKPNLQRLQRNDRAMIRQICNVRPQDTGRCPCICTLIKKSDYDDDMTNHYFEMSTDKTYLRTRHF